MKLKNLKIILLTLFITMGSINPSISHAAVDIMDIQYNLVNNKVVQITWRTNTDTSGKVLYGTSENSMPAFIIDQSVARNHSIEIGNLQPNTKYYFQVQASDSTGSVYSFINSFTTEEGADNKAPAISNHKVAYLAGNLAVITWQTDEKSSTLVEYGINKTYSKQTSGKSGVTDHMVIIKNLNANTDYYARFWSIDADGNSSGYYHQTFRTLQTNAIDKENLIIKNLRPSGPQDSNIGRDKVIVEFETNHYAKGTIVVSGAGIYKKADLDYSTKHKVEFENLLAESQYTIKITLDDVFSKKLNKSVDFSTVLVDPVGYGSSVIYGSSSGSASGSSSGTGTTLANSTNYSSANLTCSADIFKAQGYYGKYYQIKEDQRYPLNLSPMETGYYEDSKYKFSRIDNNINFGKNFYAIGKNNFSTHWRGLIAIQNSGDYSFKLSADDNAWIYIDGELNTSLHAKAMKLQKPQSNYLQRGFHTIEIYFANRGRSGSTFGLDFVEPVVVFPLPPGCTALQASKHMPGKFDELFKTKASPTTNTSDFVVIIGENNGQTPANNTNNNNVVLIDEGASGVSVLGESMSLYTPAKALYKIAGNPSVFALMNNQLHYISSPASFREYGYSWSEIEAVDTSINNQYQRARLIKTPNDSSVYFLYQKPQNQWLKIKLNSPTVFISYPGNYWGKIVTINEIDMNNYPDVKLIKTANSSEVYYLEGDTKHFVSAGVFAQRGFNPAEVAVVNQTHLDSYITGSPLK